MDEIKPGDSVHYMTRDGIYLIATVISVHDSASCELDLRLPDGSIMHGVKYSESRLSCWHDGGDG